MTTVRQIAARVRAGASATAIVEQTFARIAERDPALNCFTLETRERALRRAERIDADVAAGRDPGPLAGVPFAVKNLFDIAGEVTLAGSKLRASCAPAARDALVVARLEAAGAVLVGALNMDEFAYGFVTENSHYGPTRNPHDITRIAGGSSGGSAAAVAAGLVPFSLGSDTNGSIRVPAALCGVYGVKPTYGRLGRSGTVPFVQSLDHVGAFARTAGDLALVYDALQGPDPADGAYRCRPFESAASATVDVGALRIGVLTGWFRRDASEAALAALERVADALNVRQSVDWAEARAARSAAFCLSAAEGGSLHLSALRESPQEFDPATRDRLIAGAMQPADVLVRAQRFRRRFLGQVLETFRELDVLLAPATPFAATPIGQAKIRLGGQEVSVRANLGMYTQPLSFVGLPVLTVPVCRPGELPLGVQLVAAPWQEALLFRVAEALEQQGVTGPLD